ncbi:MAG: cupin domain-containing protein [Nitrosopumilus sp. B06]|nr:MAG: cupin domain-containing protein [Nitrosopumilus sp. B06]
MKTEFNVSERAERLKKSRTYFDTFINRAGLAAGVLVLQPGEEDTQEPHDTDEVYYVISGDGFLRMNKKDYKISREKMFFVSRGMEHCFHGNKKELRVLYFFGGS